MEDESDRRALGLEAKSSIQQPRFDGTSWTFSNFVERGRADHVVPWDWDGDGRVDLLLGSTDGALYLSRNLGRELEGIRFPEPLRWPFFSELELLEHQQPSADPGSITGLSRGDLDGDGEPELLMGLASGEVLAATDFGQGSRPRWQSLVSPCPPDELGRRSGPSARPCAVDWDRDGRMDLVVGDAWSLFVEGPDLDAAGQQRKRELEAALLAAVEDIRHFEAEVGADLDERVDELRRERRSNVSIKERARIRRELRDRHPELGATRVRLRSLERELRSMGDHHERHARVWVYLRRSPAGD